MEGIAEAVLLSESSGEGTKASEDERPKESRGKKISRVVMSSDESEPEDELQGKPKGETKKRGKSQRHKEKEQRRSALVKQLKEKMKTSEVSSLRVFRKSLFRNVIIANCCILFLCAYFQESPLPKAFNDSGCLLADNDLFDAQLEEDTAEGVIEEEESLDAIRAAVKKKAKNKV